MFSCCFLFSVPTPSIVHVHFIVHLHRHSSSHSPRKTHNRKQLKPNSNFEFHLLLKGNDFKVNYIHVIDSQVLDNKRLCQTYAKIIVNYCTKKHQSFLFVKNENEILSSGA